MNGKIIAACLAIILLFGSGYSIVESYRIDKNITPIGSEWSTFQQNLHRNGTSLLKGNITTPKVMWAFTVNGSDGLIPFISDVDLDGQMDILIGGNTLAILNGKSGAVIWENTSISGFPAVGDINGDGEIELVVASDWLSVTALAWHNKSVIWRVSPGGNSIGDYGIPTLIDVNSDGALDIIIGVTGAYNQSGALYALNGKNGTILWNSTIRELYGSPGSSQPTSPICVGDVNNDGVSELIVSDDLYGLFYVINSVNGNIEWSNLSSGPPSIADIDNDGNIEILSGRFNDVYALNGATGAIKWARELNATLRSSPVIGDVDGDGKLEVAVEDETGTVTLLNGVDGSILWEDPNTSNTIIKMPPILVDINGDSKKEVLAASDGVLTVYSGTDGTSMFIFACGEKIRSLAFGDIDSDGLGELIITASDSWIFLKEYIYAIDCGEYPIPLHLQCGVMPRDKLNWPQEYPNYWPEDGGQITFNTSELNNLIIVCEFHNGDLLFPGVGSLVLNVNGEIISDLGTIEYPRISPNWGSGSGTNWTVQNITKNIDAHLTIHIWKTGFKDAWYNVTVHIIGNFTNGNNNNIYIVGSVIGVTIIFIVGIATLVTLKRRKR